MFFIQATYPVIRYTATATVTAFMLLLAGCSNPPDTTTSADLAPSSKASTASPGTASPKAASLPGDLTLFRTIAVSAVNAASLVDENGQPAAVSHIKNLEVAWGGAEAGLKPRAADDWHVLDRAIDKVL